jgi:hypothetical protein
MKLVVGGAALAYFPLVVVWLAVVLWVVIVAWSLALMRAATASEPGVPGTAHDPEPEPERPAARRERRVRGPVPERVIVAVEIVMLVGSIAGAALLSDQSQWTPPELVGLLAVLVIGSDFLTLHAKRFRI